MNKNRIMAVMMMGLFSLSLPTANTCRSVAADDAAHTHDGWTQIDSWSDFQSHLSEESSKNYLAAGNYYLTDDIAIEKDIYVKGNTEISFCLNGRIVSSRAKDTTSTYSFYIDTYGQFTLYDDENSVYRRSLYFYDAEDTSGNSNKDGVFESLASRKHSDLGNVYGDDYVMTEGGLFTGFRNSVFQVDSQGFLTVNGGTFVGNYAEYGSCIYSTASGNITINGGTFIGNASGTEGGVIRAGSGSEVIINDVNACYNTSDEGGFIASGGKLNINGGTYRNNKGTRGSVICAHRILNVNGGLFTDNRNGSPTNPTSGGVIYSETNDPRPSYSLTDGVFKNNVSYTDELCSKTDGGAYGVISNYCFDTSGLAISLGGSIVMDDNYVVDLSSVKNGMTAAYECNFKMFARDLAAHFNIYEDDIAPMEGMSVGLYCADVGENGFVIEPETDNDYSCYFTSDIENQYITSEQNGNKYSLKCLSVSNASDGGSINPDGGYDDEKTVVSVGKISSENGIDTYMITYSDGTTATFTMAAEKTNKDSAKTLSTVALVLASVSLVGVGLSLFFLAKKKQK